MSLTDKINDMITASEASAKCLRDATMDLPARIVSSVSPALNRPFRHTDYPLLSKYLYYVGQLLSGTNMYGLIR